MWLGGTDKSAIGACRAPVSRCALRYLGSDVPLRELATSSRTGAVVAIDTAFTEAIRDALVRRGFRVKADAWALHVTVPPPDHDERITTIGTIAEQARTRIHETNREVNERCRLLFADGTLTDAEAQRTRHAVREHSTAAITSIDSIAATLIARVRNS